MEPTHANFAGGIPENYDQGLGPNIFVDFGSDLANRVASLTTGRILELAAGTGIVTRLLRDAVDEDCELVATDLNEPMLEVAMRKFDEEERVSFQQADALDLPFEDGSFDSMVCQFGVMFFPDRFASYREAFRVLKPGGRYFFNVWCSFEHNPFSRIAHETTAAFFSDNPPGFYRVPFSYHDADEIRAALEGAGFEDVATSTERREKTIEDIDRFAQGIVFGNPVVDEIRSRGDVEPETVQAAVAKAFREEFGEEPSTMPLQALVISCVRP